MTIKGLSQEVPVLVIKVLEVKITVKGVREKKHEDLMLLGNDFL